MVPPRARDEMDSTLLRAALEVLGCRHGDSYLVARTDGMPVFATARARRLLGPSPRLPECLTLRAQAALAGEEDEPSARLTLPGTRHGVSAWVIALPNTPCHVLFGFRESVPQGAGARQLAERLGVSMRATQLAVLASRGLKYKEIGEQLQLSEATVKTYMHSLFRDVGVRSRAELGALVERLSHER